MEAMTKTATNNVAKQIANINMRVEDMCILVYSL